MGSLGRAYLGVAIGADRDDERANRDFLRTQRIALYGDYLAAVDETRVLMEPFLPPYQPDGSRTSAFLTQARINFRPFKSRTVKYKHSVGEILDLR